MSGPVPSNAAEGAEAAPDREALQELRALLNLMLIDLLKQQETEALEAAKSDPSALERYRALNRRRLEVTAIKIG